MKKNMIPVLFSFLVIGLLFPGCQKPVRDTKKTGPVKVACLGASNTRGFQIPRVDENCYPGQLQKLLGDGYIVGNFGVGGTCALKKGRIPYWKTLAIKQAVEFEPDIVIFDFGGNDGLPQDREEFIFHFVRDYRSLVNLYAKLPSKPKVYILCPITYYNDSYGIAEKYSGYLTPMIKQVARQTHAETIDVCTTLKDDFLNFNYDRVHLSVQGCGKVAEIVKDRIVNP